MANKQISQLTAKPTPVASTDQFGIDDNASDSWKITVANLQTYFNGLYLPLAGGTMTGDIIAFNATPPSSLSYATKSYVDTVATGLNIQPSCRVATTAALTVTYSNGSSGVGATLTNAGAQAALAIDGVTLSVNDRVLVKDQASALQNGIYTVTNVGSGASNWVMTRATDFDTPTEIQPGDLVLVNQGTVNISTSWVQTATVATVGTDSIVWNQFGSDVNTVVTNIQNSAYNYAVDSGAANAYVATLSPAVTSYVAGLIVYLKVANANTTASTLNVNGLGVKNIKNTSGGDPAANDLVANEIAILQYDGTNFQLINLPYARIAKAGANGDITSMTELTGTLRAPTAIASSAGLNCLAFNYAASAVNYLLLSNNSTGQNPTFVCTGTDSNIHFQFQVKNADFWLSDNSGTSAPGFRMYNAAATQYFRTVAGTLTGNRAATWPDTDIEDWVVQRVSTQTGAVATGTTTTPFDDTIPQITEGNEYMTLAITPKNTANILKIEVNIGLLSSTAAAGNVLTIALFQDATANALAAITTAIISVTSAVVGGGQKLTHTMSAGTTSSTTFRVRIGASAAGTTTFNGTAGGRIYGGVMASSITITEYSS